MKKKTIALLVAAVMLFGVVAGGTLAWLTAKSADVVNTFTVGDINIELDEAPLKADGTLDKDAKRVNKIDDYKMIPGVTLPKDPQVRVLADSEDCYLFVKITESANFDSFMSYGIADGWVQLVDKNGVAVEGVYYYKEVVHAGDEFYVLKDNQVEVLKTVTKAEMDKLDGVDSNNSTESVEAKAEKANRPTLTFTAYAIQSNYLETNVMAEIWELASGN